MVGEIVKVISACGTTLLLDLNKSLSTDQSYCSILSRCKTVDKKLIVLV